MGAILVNWTSYANALSSLETVQGHFPWDLGPMNVAIKSQKS